MADDCSTFREPAAAEEGAFLAVPDNEFAVFALITFEAGRLRRGLGRQDVAIFIDTEYGFAIWILAATEEGAEPAGFMYHLAAAIRAFMLAPGLFNHFPFAVAGRGGFAFWVSRAA